MKTPETRPDWAVTRAPAKLKLKRFYLEENEAKYFRPH